MPSWAAWASSRHCPRPLPTSNKVSFSGRKKFKPKYSQLESLLEYLEILAVDVTRSFRELLKRLEPSGTDHGVGWLIRGDGVERVDNGL